MVTPFFFIHLASVCYMGILITLCAFDVTEEWGTKTKLKPNAFRRNCQITSNVVRYSRAVRSLLVLRIPHLQMPSFVRIPSYPAIARHYDTDEDRRTQLVNGPVRIRHSSHDFGWQSSHSVDLAGLQVKMASIEIWIP